LQKPGPRPSENISFLQGVGQIVQNDPTLTQKGISEQLQQSGVNISRGSVCNTLKKLGLSRKRVKRVASKTITPQLIADRKSYALLLRTMPTDKLLFLDETGFNLHTSRNYGYSPINVPCNAYVPANRGKNVSFLSIINKHRILHTKSIIGSFNGDSFLMYLKECMDKGFLTTDKYIIMDNCRIHKTTNVTNFFETNNLNAIYLPPYSPQLNPIEEIFSLIKSRYHSKRPKANNAADIQRYVHEVIDEINNNTQISIESYYEHMATFLDIAFVGGVF